jgi:hypothetical protein
MDSTSRIPNPEPPVTDQRYRAVDAPARMAGERPRRDWLSIAWTAILVIYCAAVLPLLGWAIVQAL